MFIMFILYSYCQPDYVKSLEQEIKELKNKNRQIDNASKDHVKSAQAEEALIRKEVSNDSLVRAHVESLNNTIGKTRLCLVNLGFFSRLSKYYFNLIFQHTISSCKGIMHTKIT